MSSQGPAVGANTASSGFTGCYGPTSTSQLPAGYPFSTRSFRDSSDWIAYKKQARMSNDLEIYLARDKGFTTGNNFRLDLLNGKNKCNSCLANAFNN
jgi:hypothetical protein